MASKTILLKYQESGKKVVIPAETTNDLDFLESSFRSLYQCELKESNVAITFQRYDEAFDEFIDLETDEEVHHLDKINVIATPTVATSTTEVSWPVSITSTRNPVEGRMYTEQGV